MGFRIPGNQSLGFAMNYLAGRYTGQLSLFDVRGFNEASLSMDRSRVRLGPAGKPWVGVEEVNAAAESVRRMVEELEEEITELNSEYRRLVGGPQGLPSDEDEECSSDVTGSSVPSSG